MKIIPFKKLSKDDQNLINEAEKIIRNAYDPYSQFYVSCAILTTKGNIYKGVNQYLCLWWNLC